MSPYENRLQLDGFHRVALMIFVQTDRSAEFESAVENRPSDLNGRLHAAGIDNLNIFTKSIDDRTFACMYFDFKGSAVGEAQDTLFASSDWFGTLSPFLTPHPRAARAEQPWLRIELITVVAADALKPETPTERIGLISGLKPESELSYRTLHQTNWPGVVECMRRCNYRNWTTFLFEVGEELFLFTCFEYVGRDRDADNDLMATDPTTQRWWKHTVPCLIELEPGWGPWTSTKQLLQIN